MDPRLPLLLTVALLASPLAAAQEGAKYNLGSAQGQKELTITPDGTVTANIYFYNVFGNRTTHIALAVAQAPPDWTVTIEPPLQTVAYDVAGVVTEVQENLAVEPDEIVNGVPAGGREGFTYLPAPNVGGFIPAKEVVVNITAPSGVPLGTTFPVEITAEGSWLGQQGTVAFKQDRSFSYQMTTESETFYERRISSTAQGEEGTPAPAPPLSALLLLGLGVLVAVVVGFVLLRLKPGP